MPIEAIRSLTRDRLFVRRPNDLKAMSPGLDLVAPGKPAGTVMVASQPRTGSSLLCRALEDTGKVGVPREYLNPAVMGLAYARFGLPTPPLEERVRRHVRRLRGRRTWWAVQDIDPASLPWYIDTLISRRTTGNGVFSLKIHWANFVNATDRYGFGLALLPQPISWIHIERRDLIAQAVSLARAKQTGSFGKAPEDSADAMRAHYDDAQVLAAYDRAVRGRAAWHDFFATQQIEPVHVWYEDLDSNFEGTVRRVLTSLDMAEEPIPTPRTQRQADDTTEIWIEQFVQRHPELERFGSS